MNLKEIQEIESLDLKTFRYMSNKLKINLKINLDFVKRVENELIEIKKINNARYRMLIPRHEECIFKEKVKIEYLKELIKDLDSKIAFLKGWGD